MCQTNQINQTFSTKPNQSKNIWTTDLQPNKPLCPAVDAAAVAFCLGDWVSVSPLFFPGILDDNDYSWQTQTGTIGGGKFHNYFHKELCGRTP